MYFVEGKRILCLFALCIVMVVGFLVSIKVLPHHKDIVKLGGRADFVCLLCTYITLGLLRVIVLEIDLLTA